MGTAWLTDKDPEPNAGTVVENESHKNFVHSNSGWLDSSGGIYDWETVASRHGYGPVRIIIAG